MNRGTAGSQLLQLMTQPWLIEYCVHVLQKLCAGTMGSTSHVIILHTVLLQLLLLLLLLWTPAALQNTETLHVIDLVDHSCVPVTHSTCFPPQLK